MARFISKELLSRRDFLRRLTVAGGATALNMVLQGCSISENSQAFPSQSPALTLTPTITPQIPTPTMTSTNALQSIETGTGPTAAATEIVNDGKTRVAIVKTMDRAEGVRQAVDLLGINSFSGKSVFLKPNFNSADPTPGSTHLDVLATLVTLLKDKGAVTITVGDRSGMGNTRQVMEQLGVFRSADELGFIPMVFDELSADGWEMMQPANSHWQQGFPFARPVLEADAVVQTCCLKTHRYGGHFTLSLKNSVGMVAKRHPQINHDFMQELHSSPHQRRMIAEINSAYTPALIVMDGVEAFISGGPDVGEKVFPGVILASTDRIAIDAVGIALLRYFGCKTETSKGRIFEQEQIATAIELGLGVSTPENIEILTADADSAAYSSIIQGLLLEG